MTTLTTSADILDDILFRCGEATDGTSDFNAHAISALNRAYRAMWMGGGEFVKGMNEPWLWLKKDPPGTLILEPVYETGTVSVTNNNASITFSATIATSRANWFFKVDNHPDIFRISAHTAGTDTATLDSVYTGDTDTGATYQLMKLEYELASDVLRVIAPMRVRSTQYEIDGVELPALEREWPLHLAEPGVPEVFAPVTETKVRFNRYGGQSSTELIRVEYDYLRKPTSELADDSTEPLVPLQHRQVLADIALVYLLIAKADDKADIIGLQAKAGLESMAADNRKRMSQMSRRTALIEPRQGQLPRNFKTLIVG